MTALPCKSARRLLLLLLLATGVPAAIAAPAAAQDPAQTPTIYVPGYDNNGPARHGVYGVDRHERLVDSVAVMMGHPLADGAAILPHNVVAMTTYYGDTASAYFSAADVAAIEATTAQWGGGVPRYAMIVAKYARDVMRRSGTQKVNLVSASFGSLVVRWLIEKDVDGLASEGRIARWLSLEGVSAGNWAASREELIHYLDALDPQPIDVTHMSYGWVSANLHSPREDADSPHYAGILMGALVATDDSYNMAALSTLMRTYDEFQPNDGVQAAADAAFRNVSPASRFDGQPPTIAWFPTTHYSTRTHRAAWAQVATFLTQRRRVTVTMTRATVANLHEPQEWYWDWRPAEVVFETRAYSPRIEALWNIHDPLCTRAKDGAAAPLRRYQQSGETQTISQVVFDDFVMEGETQLRLELHATEVDYDWRYGIYETAQLPYYDDMGGGAIHVSTLAPGTYPFSTGSWSCELAVTVHDYPFSATAGVEPPAVGPLALRVSPNPHRGSVRIALAGAAPSAAAESWSLEVFDLGGRRVRTLSGDARTGFVWDGRDQNGARLEPGVYLHRLRGPAGTTRSGRSLLLR